MNAQALAESVIRTIARWRWAAIGLVLLGVLASFVAFGQAVDWDFSKQPVDNGIRIWFLEDDPALVSFREFHAEFGNDEVVLIGFHAPEGIFTPANLTLIDAVSKRLEAIEEIDSVTSLATVVYNGVGQDDEIIVENLYTGVVSDEATAARIWGRLAESPLLRNDLVSKDLQTTLITARFGLYDDIDERRGAILAKMDAELRAAFKASGRAEREWAWAGLAVANEALNAIAQRDMFRYTSLSVLVIAVCLWFSLRRIVPVLVAMASVLVACGLLNGLYLGTGHTINMVTMILPTLVMVIGLTDSVYFITTYYQDRARLEAEGLTKREAIVKSLGFCFLPGLFNSITASVGFLAFATAKMEVIRTFGIFAGVGIILAFLMSVVICTVGCDLFDIRPLKEEDSAGGAWTRGFLKWLSGFVNRRRHAIVAASLLVFIVAVGGILKLEVNSDPLEYFYPDHQVHKDAEWIERNYGPAGPLEFVLDTGAPDGVKEPELLNALAELERHIVKTEVKVGNTVSIVGVVSRLNELVMGTHTIPDSLAAVDQELTLFYDPDNSDDPLKLVDFPLYQKARVTVRVGKMSMVEVDAMIQRIEAKAKELLPEGTTFKASGYVPLYVRLVDYLIQGQISSLATTFVVIFLVIAILFRSLRYALISLPPNIIPVAMTLGFMGYAGIHLDGATVLIASISLGVAVDDTIHFIFKFREVYRETGDDFIAVEKTLKTTGVAIATTSLIIALGFSVIALGDLRSMAYFGLLTAVTMLSALVAELFVTPAVILTFGPRRNKTPEPSKES